MTKTLIPTVIITIALAGGLSGCAVSIEDPAVTNSPTSSTPNGGPSDDSTTGEFATGDCDGKDISVDQDGSTAILSGRCGVVNVIATGATVTLEEADSVIVTGLDNTIIMTGEAGAVTLEGDTNSFNSSSGGIVKIMGNGNQVTLSAADDVSLSGNDNFIVWSEGAASATDTGTGNTVLAP